MRIKLILLSLLLASCSDLSIPLVSPYKMDIHQGNLLNPAMRENLKLGMSKQQVHYVLGTPLINDAYHGNRWDYVYRLERGRKVVETQRLTLYFAGDYLASIDDGSHLEGAVPVATAISAAPPALAAPVPVVEPVVAKPAATEIAETSQPEATVGPVAEVQQTLNAWAEAWSAKDLRKYLAFYSPGFRADGMNRKEWGKRRTDRIRLAKTIKVTLSDVKVDVRDARHAAATFAQSLRADNSHQETRKNIALEKVGDSWLIVSEQTIK